MNNLFSNPSKFYAALQDAGKGTKKGLFFGDSWMSYMNMAQPSDLSIFIAHTFRKALFLNMGNFGMDSDSWTANVGRVLDLEKEFAFDVIAISIGGNDIMGKRMPDFLKKTNQPQDRGTRVWTQTPPIVDQHVYLAKFENAIERVLIDVGMIVKNVRVNAPDAVVVTHTYDVPFASGIGWEFAGIKAGPWIKPYLHAVGVDDPADQRTLLSWLLNEFAAVLRSYVDSHSNVLMVNSIGTLTTPDLWANELHPTYDGFEKLVKDKWKPVLAPLF